MYPCTSKVSKLLDERAAHHVTGRVTRRVASYIESPSEKAQGESLGESRLGELSGKWEIKVGKLWASRWESNSADDKAVGESLEELIPMLSRPVRRAPGRVTSGKVTRQVTIILYL
jgi:hypothetical protein